MNAGLNRVLCIGGATIDRKYRAYGTLRPGTSNPAQGERTFGGVARNVAENLARLRADVALLTIVGDDEGGRSLVDHLDKAGVDTRFVAVAEPHRTAEYVAILEPDGELALGIAAMDIFDALTVDRLDALWPDIASSPWIFADCNCPQAILSMLISGKPDHGYRLAIETVSVPKAKKLRSSLNGIDVLFLNRDEAVSLLGDEALTPRDAVEAFLEQGVGNVVQTQGADGVLIGTPDGVFAHPAVAVTAVDVTGAGDALTATVIDALLRGIPIREAARLGTVAAALTIESPHTVRPDLSPALLQSSLGRLPPSAREEAPWLRTL